MRAIALRLNEIITNDPIIDFTEEDIEIEKFLYDSVMGSYKYAYVNADNEEQFVSDFTGYWNRNIKYFKLSLFNQIALGENLFKARIEQHTGDTTTIDTPDLKDTEEWTFGRSDKTEYGKKLTIAPDITETDKGGYNGSDTLNGTDETHTVGKNTKYNSQVLTDDTTVTRTPTDLKTDIERTNNNTHTRQGTEEHTNSGEDTVSSSGTNGRTLTRDGNRNIVFTDNRTNTVTTYNPEIFYQYIRSSNIVSEFIDIFSPLFNDIIAIY